MLSNLPVPKIYIHFLRVLETGMFFLLVLSLWTIFPFKIAAINNDYNLATSTNWNIRFDGPPSAANNSNFGRENTFAVDINNNGKLDVILGSLGADNNARASSGSVYIIYDDILNNYSGTGNTVDLNNTSNFSLRIDGALAGDVFGGKRGGLADLNGDNKLDLVLGSSAIDNGGNNTGSVYVLYNSLLGTAVGQGNTLDLASSTSYNVRIDGAAASDSIPATAIQLGDINNDNRADLIFGSLTTDHLYIIYSTLFDALTGTGNTLSLATATSYNIRLDGADANFLTFNSLYPRLRDLDNDGKLDLFVFSPAEGQNSRVNSGSTYIFYNSTLDDFTGTGNNVAVATNFNVRIEGAAANESFGFGATTANLDSDSNKELIIGALSTDAHLSNAGAIYFMDDTVFSGLSGVGNRIDLADTSKYLLRLDGPIAGENLPHNFLEVLDFNSDGKLDIVASAQRLDLSGVFYALYNNTFRAFLGTPGTALAVDVTGGDYLTYREPTAGDNFNFSSMDVHDIDGDGSLDILGAAYNADNNSRTNSGSVFLIYNFPHTVAAAAGGLTETGNYNLTGTITASSNASKLPSGVQYLVDSNSPSSASWAGCTADDAAFDEASEAFSCALTGLSEGTHTVYTRAYDVNLSYTPQAHYDSSTIIMDSFPHTITPTTSPMVSHSSSFDLTGTLDASTAAFLPSGVQYLVNDDDPSSPDWAACTAADGTYDEAIEAFTCPLTGLEEGDYTVYLRAYDSNDIFTDDADYVAVPLSVTPLPGGSSGGGGGGGGGERGGSSGPSSGSTGTGTGTNTPPSDTGTGTGTGEQGNDSGFSDVTGDEWFTTFTDQLVTAGIMQGYPQGDQTILAPDRDVTRAEFVKMLAVLLKVPELTPEEQEEQPFPDTTEHWAKSYIEQAKIAGWIDGYEDGLFHPDAAVTRAEAAKIIAEAFHLTALPEAALKIFTDVPTEAWFAPYIHTLESLGILEGYSDNTFRPEQNITRAESAKLIVKAAELSTIPNSLN